METLTFEKLPEAISEINQKLDVLLTLQKNKEPESDRLFNLNQLMDYLPEKPKRQTVYGWVSTHSIPFEKHGRLYFRKSEIDEWLNNGRQMKLSH